MAPRNASTSLKKGSARASKFAITTNMVLQVSLKKLMFKFKFILPMLIGYSRVMNLDLGHLFLICDSAATNTGCVSTYIQCNGILEKKTKALG